MTSIPRETYHVLCYWPGSATSDPEWLPAECGMDRDSAFTCAENFMREHRYNGRDVRVETIARDADGKPVAVTDATTAFFNLRMPRCSECGGERDECSCATVREEADFQWRHR